MRIQRSKIYSSQYDLKQLSEDAANVVSEEDLLPILDALKSIDNKQYKKYCYMLESGYSPDYVGRLISYYLFQQGFLGEDDDIDLSEYQYIGTTDDGYFTYRKIVDGRGVWVAQDQNEKYPPFHITYEQARGYDPIITEHDSTAKRLSRELGRMLLPNSSTRIGASYDSSDTYWMAKYVDMNKKTHKIMFKFNSPDYDEAEEEMDAVIPEAYTSAKLLGKCNPKSAESDGFELLGCESITGSEENEEDIEDVEQEYSSKDTSINKNKLPAIFRLVSFEPDSINLDFGGGKFDNASEYLESEYGVKNLIYDKYNRTPEHNSEVIKEIRSNGGADTATCSNVLNVIKEPDARLAVLRNIKKLVKPGGKVYITVYEGSGKGNEGPTKSGYQLNKKTGDYMDEIQQVFPDATRKGKLVVAVNAASKINSGRCVNSSADINPQLLSDVENALIQQMMKYGFDESEAKQYTRVDGYMNDAGQYYVIEVGAEVGYDALLEISEKLDEVIVKYDSDAYFDMVDPGLLEAYVNATAVMSSTSITSAKQPKWWNSIFKEKVIKAYKAGELTFDNIEEWETKYNDGIKPRPSLGTKEILQYYLKHPDSVESAYYGGAFDIDPEEYWTKDDILEFGYELEDRINDSYGKSLQLSDTYIENHNMLFVELQDSDGMTYTAEIKIDLRRAKTSRDLIKVYIPEAMDQISNQLAFDDAVNSSTIISAYDDPPWLDDYEPQYVDGSKDTISLSVKDAELYVGSHGYWDIDAIEFSGDTKYYLTEYSVPIDGIEVSEDIFLGFIDNYHEFDNVFDNEGTYKISFDANLVYVIDGMLIDDYLLDTSTAEVKFDPKQSSLSNIVINKL